MVLSRILSILLLIFKIWRTFKKLSESCFIASLTMIYKVFSFLRYGFKIYLLRINKSITIGGKRFMLNKVWFRTGIFIIMLFILIKLFMEVHEVFTPIATIIGSVFLPFLISGFLFYICLPFQNILERWGFPRWASILTIFIGLIAIIAIVVSFIAPIIISNINNLIKQTPALQKKLNILLILFKTNGQIT